MTSNAYDMLIDIEQRCKANSKGLPRQEVAKQPWIGIAFKVSNKQYVVALDEVDEVIRPPLITQAPSTVHWMVGVTSLRGLLLPVVDLQGLLGEELVENVKHRRILVIKVGGQQTGLLVDQVTHLHKFFDVDKCDMSSSVSITYAPYIKGAFKLGDETWNIFSLQAVVGSQQFQQILREN